MPWILDTIGGRRFTGASGDVLIPLNKPVEIPQWAYDLMADLLADPYSGVTAWTPGASTPSADVLDPLPKHVVPAEFYDPHRFDAEGGLVSDDTHGGLPV
jgi:hypothetical protein